jgi:hypothetical protein
MPAHPVSVRAAIGAVVLATTLCGLSGIAAFANDSPHGDAAAAWPSLWQAYYLKSGSAVHDVVGDVGCGSGYCDVSSGSSGTLPSVYYASNGSTVFLRIRLLGDPRNPSAGGFQSTTWEVQIAVNGTARVTVGLDGKNPHRDFVYVANADGSAYTEIYATPFNNLGGELSAGARGLPDGSGQYFVDFQVPLWRITQQSGGAVTDSTPVQLFFGTSQSANLSVLNKDFMVGSSVDFGSGSTITLVLPPPPPPPAPSAPPGGSGPPAPAQGSEPPGWVPDASLPAPMSSVGLTLGLILVLVVGGIAAAVRLRPGRSRG